MDRKQVLYFSTDASLNECGEHSISEIESICRKGVDDYLNDKRRAVANGQRFNISWDLPIENITLRFYKNWEGDVDAEINVYRLETDNEMNNRVEAERKEKERQKNKIALAAREKKKREDEAARRMKDPEYLKFLELKNKYSK